MATSSELDRVSMIVLRYMRRPIFVLVCVYAVGVIGMALVPGPALNGETQRMSLFHSFYFFTYTATTTGFGEIPTGFSDEQRLWAVLCLYMGVIAWLYAIGSVIGLIQNPHFVSALSERRLARQVRRISEPFYLLCGFGDTGSLLARGLSDHYLSAVVLDRDVERIKALGLRDYKIAMPGLCADASVPKHLLNAGVRGAHCKGVLILTGDEDINLKIAIMARYLNPTVPILCRSSSVRHKEHLQDLDSVTVIDPFEILAQLTRLALARPGLHNLNSWLVRARGVDLGRSLQLPRGRWILCGYGRMGRELHEQLSSVGIETCVIESRIEENIDARRVVMSEADYQALRESGVEDAVGIVAGTNRDASNLGVLMSARRLNPDIFTVVRQNHHENQQVFDAAHASYIVQTSLTTARRILKHLISPLSQALIDELAAFPEQRTTGAIERLKRVAAAGEPHLWQLTLCTDEARALCERLDAGDPINLRDLLRDPADRDAALRCVPLVLQRGNRLIMLPEEQELLACNDVILFCGTERSKRSLLASTNNHYTLQYLLTGTDPPRGFFFSWIAARFGHNASSSL